MHLIDLLIIIFIIVSFARGLEIGAVRQVFSTVGFFGGLLVRYDERLLSLENRVTKLVNSGSVQTDKGNP